MPKLQVLAGPSPSSLVPITKFVNSRIPQYISSDLFQGQVLVNIKGFTDPDGATLDSEYFTRDDRAGISWSIQVQGTFLQSHTADDILFGNTFDRPLKLPWGSAAALKFMKYIDPVIEHDLTSTTKPWALSPLISTMPHFAHRRLTQCNHARSSLQVHSSKSDSILDNPPPFPPPTSIEDNTSELQLALLLPSQSSSASISPSYSPSYHPSPSSSQTNLLINGSTIKHKQSSSSLSQKLVSKLTSKESRHKQSPLPAFSGATQRRAYFSDANHRQAVVFGPQDLITLDFCYGFLEFSPNLSLRLPGGISFDLMHYWDGQPVRFVCCERSKSCLDEEQEGKGQEPWGKVFWCVSIELAEDDNEDRQLSDKT